jgi:6-pyruvoyl-tetrahydropterin synthase
MIKVGEEAKFAFCAAPPRPHPVHGHSFAVTMRLHGDVERAGMICDFGAVKSRWLR